jgi:glucose-1-phosphate thymidylyltransferase
LFRAYNTRIADMVAVDQTGQVRELVIKPLDTRLKYDWVFAVWTPAFTEFLHDYLAEPRTAAESPNPMLPMELTMGHVIQAAIDEGIRTQSLTFRRSTYLDIGTGEGLRRLVANGCPVCRHAHFQPKRK